MLTLQLEVVQKLAVHVKRRKNPGKKTTKKKTARGKREGRRTVRERPPLEEEVVRPLARHQLEGKHRLGGKERVLAVEGREKGENP